MKYSNSVSIYHIQNVSMIFTMPIISQSFTTLLRFDQIYLRPLSDGIDISPCADVQRVKRTDVGGMIHVNIWCQQQLCQPQKITNISLTFIPSLRNGVHLSRPQCVNSLTHVFKFSWQLFICVAWQQVHSNSAISLATMKWGKNWPF